MIAKILLLMASSLCTFSVLAKQSSYYACVHGPSSSIAWAEERFNSALEYKEVKVNTLGENKVIKFNRVSDVRLYPASDEDNLARICALFHTDEKATKGNHK